MFSRTTILTTCVAFAVLFVTLFPAAVSTAGTLDQEYFDALPQYSEAVMNGSSLAQTFTVGLTGSLDRVELQLGRAIPTAPLLIELRRTSGGVPDTSGAGLLASLTVDGTPIPPVNFPSFMTGFDLGSQSVSVTSGELLAVVLSSATTEWYLWALDEGNPYAGGQTFRRNGTTGGLFVPITGFDGGFRTFVAVPEPNATLGVVLAGAALVAAERRRRHR